MLIKSDRKFGIEIELSAPSQETNYALRDGALGDWYTHDDGSLRCQNPIEVVSPVLQGARGEQSVMETMSILNDFDMDATHKSCGFHVHLDGKEFKEETKTKFFSIQEFKEYWNNKPKEDRVVGVHYMSYSAVRSFNRRVGLLQKMDYEAIDSYMPTYGNLNVYQTANSHIMTKLDKDIKLAGIRLAELRITSCIDVSEYKKLRDSKRKAVDSLYQQLNKLEVVTDAKAQRVLYDSLDELEVKYLKSMSDLVDFGSGGKVAVTITSNTSFEKLQALFYLYTLYSDVFVGIVPTSRKKQNSYCVSFGDSFDLRTIASLKDMDELKKTWYKVKDKRSVLERIHNNYDDSRYHNFNFHSLWCRHGTIEVRSHGSTIDPRRILLWTCLHQFIIDAVANETITLDKLLEVKLPETLEGKTRSFLDLMGFPSHLEIYVKRLVEHFNSLTV